MGKTTGLRVAEGAAKGSLMPRLPDLHLFRIFEMYLSLLFLLSTYLRIRQYRVVMGLVKGFSGRWPRLFELVKKHGGIFLTWGTFFPLAVSLGLLLAQLLARQILWPGADTFTAADLREVWPAIPVVVLSGLAMA